MDLFIGEDVFFFLSSQSPPPKSHNNPLFGRGWQTPSPRESPTAIASMPVGNQATINIPLFFYGRPGLLLELDVSIPPHRPGVTIDFVYNGSRLTRAHVSRNAQTVVLKVPGTRSLRSINTLVFYTKPVGAQPGSAYHLLLTRTRIRRLRDPIGERPWWLGPPQPRVQSPHPHLQPERKI